MKFFTIFLICVLGLLLLCFVSVMFSETIEERYGLLLGLSKQKNEILTFLGVGMGGVLLTLFREIYDDIFNDISYQYPWFVFCEFRVCHVFRDF